VLPAPVKVCCICSIEEARIALRFGASWLGFVSEMPSGPGILSLDAIRDIINQLPSETQTVLLTSKVTSQGIIKQFNATGTWAIQLVDQLLPGELQHLRHALPHVKLIQVVHVRDRKALAEANSYQEYVDYLLLDSGDPLARVKTLGGTGATHDWEISRQICLESNIPVLLAGGLNPDNIQEAITRVRPHGVDLCSGVRTDGRLDCKKLKRFMNNFISSTGSKK